MTIWQKCLFWNGKFKKWQADKTASWPNDSLRKCQADEGAVWLNDNLRKCRADETAVDQMTSWENVKLMKQQLIKWQVEKMVSRCTSTLTKWQFVKNGKLMKQKVDTNGNLIKLQADETASWPKATLNKW